MWSAALSAIAVLEAGARAATLLRCRGPETWAGGGGLTTTLSTRREAGVSNSWGLLCASHCPVPTQSNSLSTCR